MQVNKSSIITKTLTLQDADFRRKIPIIGYWHRFANPNWSVDITLPSQMYLRYQMKYQRISIGATMGADKFYVDPTFASSPSVCFYQEAVMKPEIHYEYIINRHLYLSAHAGLSMILKSGLYTKNRKEVETVSASGATVKGPIVEQDRSAVPFVNVGISYSLFK